MKHIAGSDFEEETCRKLKQGHIMNKIKEYLHLKKVYDYWAANPYTYDRLDHKEATPDEYYRFALADILSRYPKAQDDSPPSDFRMSVDSIADWTAFFTNLLQNGYIQRANAYETMDSHTVQELKIIADSIDVKKSGRKTEIIQRIHDNMSADELSDLVEREKLYVVSEKGQQYLHLNPDYILLGTHTNCGVSLAEFNNHRILCGKQRNFYDTVFHALIERRFQCQLKHFWDDLWSADLKIFNIMVEESERTTHNVPLESALSYYLESLYLDTCQAWTIRDTLNGICQRNFDYDILPRIGAKACSLRKYLKFVNYEAIYGMLPPSLFTKSEFEAYIDDSFDIERKNYDFWNSKLQNRIRVFCNRFSKPR